MNFNEDVKKSKFKGKAITHLQQGGTAMPPGMLQGGTLLLVHLFPRPLAVELPHNWRGPALVSAYMPEGHRINTYGSSKRLFQVLPVLLGRAAT
jgi:hypothetical protein